MIDPEMIRLECLKLATNTMLYPDNSHPALGYHPATKASADAVLAVAKKFEAFIVGEPPLVLGGSPLVRSTS